MTDIDDNDNDENEDIEDDENNNVAFQAPFVVTSRAGNKKGDKVHKNDTPIDNASDIPLFEDADKRGMRTVTYLRVDKLNNPNAGYKGNIPTNSTLETISQLYGDGLYNISACNARHQVLRTKENVRISLDDNGHSPKALPSGAGTSDKSIEILREVIRNHDKEVERLEKSSGRTANESIANSRQFIELIKTTTEASAQRDREHMQSVNKSQQDFFANMMLASSQMFQQTLAILTMGHQHLIETLRTSKDDSPKESQVDTLLKGIMVAQGLGGNDDPDWIKALDKGGNMMTTLLKLKQGSTEPPEKESKEDTDKKPKDPNKKPPFSKSELLELLRLKKVLNDRGIDFSEMVRQSREHLIDQSEREKTDKSDSDESSSDESTEQTE